VDALYGNLSEVTSSTYDQFMDFHVGMITDDMTPFYEILTENNVPFFMVGQYPAFFDLFIEIPGTGAILEVTSQRLDIPGVPISEWNICQVNATDDTNDTMQPQALMMDNVKTTSNTTLPVINWRKTTFAAPHPADAEAFSIKFLNSIHIEQGHPGVWTRHCARIAWTEFEYTGPAGIPYQVAFPQTHNCPSLTLSLSLIHVTTYSNTAILFPVCVQSLSRRCFSSILWMATSTHHFLRL
jgi:hypothetical protein